MISKVLAIRNIGNFVDYALKGNNLDFRKLTLIYAENGSGKTTLSSIFRSLQTSDPAHIVSRKTLNSVVETDVNDVAVSILLNSSQPANFKKGAWNGQFPHIEIFDAHFVNSNVFSGNLVEHDHRRNLYHFVIGEDGLKLAEEYNTLAIRHKESGGEVDQAEKKVLTCVEGPLAAKDYIKLKPVAKIDEAIAQKERQIESLKKADELRAKAAPTEVVLPDVSMAPLVAVLEKRLEDISADAEAKVQAHIQAHLGAGGEAWLAQGVGYVKDEHCPFCREPMAASEIVRHYQGYFGAAYSALKEEIDALGRSIARTFDQSTKFSPLIRQFAANEAAFDFWSGHIAFSRPADLSGEMEAAWGNLSGLMQAHVMRKLAAPLEPVALDGALDTAYGAWVSLVLRVAEYNAHIRTIVVAVAEKKRELEAGDVQAARAELTLLRNTKSRHEAPAVDACTKYQAALDARALLDKEKKEAKKKLDAYTESVFGQYQELINKHLEIFGARFKIASTDTSYAGSKPSSSYDLEINGRAVSLGNVRENPNAPSFGNTLSEGDKSTLAFAFFLARLELDPYLAEKIVIIDDPISSLDTNRKNRTQQRISQLLGKVKQVIVQSHDPHFLKLVYGDRHGVDCRLLTISKQADGSSIQEWDMEKDTSSDYQKHFATLKRFVDEGPSGELDSVAACLRKYLEGNLRARFPDHFHHGEWLGTYVERVRSTDDEAHDLWRLRPYLDDLSDITSYSSPNHHADSPRPLTAGELRTYVERALVFGKSA